MTMTFEPGDPDYVTEDRVVKDTAHQAWLVCQAFTDQVDRLEWAADCDHGWVRPTDPDLYIHFKDNSILTIHHDGDVKYWPPGSDDNGYEPVQPCDGPEGGERCATCDGDVCLPDDEREEVERMTESQ